MTHSSHIKTNSPQAAHVRCYRGVSGSLMGGIGGIDGLQIQPLGTGDGTSVTLSRETSSMGVAAFETKLNENKLASRIV